MVLTIEDERAQESLVAAIVRADGPEVARIASALVSQDRDKLVRTACHLHAGLCEPSRCRAVIDAFSKPHRRTPSGRAELADVLATIMIGARSGRRTVVDSTVPCREAIDALIAIVSDGANGRTTSPRSISADCLRKLPARLGKSWAGVVALAGDAVRTGAEQQPLVTNDRLRTLFGGQARSDPVRSGADAEDHDGPDADGGDEDLKLCALWTFTRGAAPPPPSDPDVPPHDQQTVGDDSACDARTKAERRSGARRSSADSRVCTLRRDAIPTPQRSVRCHLVDRDPPSSDPPFARD